METEKYKKISILKNSIQNYAWGSKTAIQSLLGKTAPGEEPIAELWMGAHPKSPSMVLIGSRWIPLNKVIDEDPESILGKEVALRFAKKLPFLFKVLAADKPLSIQAHPNLNQAQSGFMRENRLKIPLDAPNRNYKDQNHKPEILCALTKFYALKGFRQIAEIVFLMEQVIPPTLFSRLEDLKKRPTSFQLKNFYSYIMSQDKAWQKQVVKEIVTRAENLVTENPAYEWMIRLNREYPGDIGVLSPLLLNFLQLLPGEAVYIPAGELHSYLYGTGIELMANSDNVLRGGLTPKHVDVEELLEIISFKAGSSAITVPVPGKTCEKVYPAPANEFLLSEITVKASDSFTSGKRRSAEIVICIKGNAKIKDVQTSEVLHLNKGKSVIIPSSVPQYIIEGNATLYKASIPL